MTSKHLDPLLKISQEPFTVADVDAVADADAMRGPPTAPPGGGGGGKPPDSPGGGGGGGGKPDGAGSKKGDLYGDQWVLLRDLDPRDGGGDGEPVLDSSGLPIAVGYDPDPNGRGGDDGLFPIYFEMDDEGDYEIPAEDLPYVQEVELERANVARAPDKVMDKALDAALGKIDNPDPEIDTIIDKDPAGRIMYSIDDGDSYSTIDSPLENLALYQYFMTLGSTGDEAGSWDQDLIDDWEESTALEKIAALVGDADTPDWDPSCLLGAAFSKETPISFDAVLYENTTLGVNVVQGDRSVDYFDFSDAAGETYNYDRAARYEDIWLKYIVVEDGAPVFEYGTVYDAVFGNEEWIDEYLVLIDDGTEFEPKPATLSGANDFAQAADDARAVIEFMHNYTAVEVDESEVPNELMTDTVLG